MDEQAEVTAPEEYSSVTITIDHLLLIDPSEKTVTKTVWSTESAHESLLAQSDYFASKSGDGLNLAEADTFRAVGAGLDQDVAYVYVVNECQTNVIVDADLWNATMHNSVLGNGTVLGTVTSFIVMATEMIRAARQQGLASRLFVFIPGAAQIERAA